MSSSFI